jgi:enamine deaminase RidA (YjgF/YER057c/UK114 family)
MAKRKVIHAGLPQHRNPIPTAVKIGQMVFTSAVGGQDPQTHETPADPQKQVENCFRPALDYGKVRAQRDIAK